MRAGRIMVLLFILFVTGIAFTPVWAQNRPQEQAANLRSQMAEVELRQAEVQARLGQLEHDLKPENIERSLAGIGSTRPEELREHRRRQLEREKTYVVAQLNELASSRTRLGAAIARADFEAHRQIVDLGNGTPSAQAQPNGTTASRTGVRVWRPAGKNKRVRRPLRE